MIKVYDRSIDLREPINRAFNKYTQILDKLNIEKEKYKGTEHEGTFNFMLKMLDSKIKDS